MGQDADRAKYYLVEVEPYRNAFDGIGIRAELFVEGAILAQIDDVGDGTSPQIDWLTKDSETIEHREHLLIHWFATEMHWVDMPDIDEAIWFLRDRWAEEENHARLSSRKTIVSENNIISQAVPVYGRVYRG